MNTRRFLKNDGFTLIELLIVIVILGFLIGMIAPRMASIIDDTVIDNVCDTNNKGMRNYVNMFLQKNGRLPGGMINLVDLSGGSYAIPATSNDDPTDGAEPFASDFASRNDPTLYLLDSDEVDEIKSKFGFTTVRHLVGTTGQPYEKVSLAASMGVTMVGAAETDAALTVTGWTDADAGGYPVGNPFWLGRIMLGMGKHSELVTQGFIQAAALCPGGIQNADNVSYNNYCLILPRLEATLARIGNFAAGDLEDVELTFVDADDTVNGERLVFTMEAQDAWEFDFTCPEGHKWPDNDNDSWIYESGI
jgi:prepilin-type N-terminal cleavage/methylation domain-containing protein